MQNEMIYLSLKRNAVVENKNIKIKNIGELLCANVGIQKQVQNTVVETLGTDETKVLSILFVIQQIQRKFPDCSVTPLGEENVIVGWKKRPRKLLEAWKVTFISLVLFFGSAFTIISFHGDTGLEKHFQNIYLQLTGKISDGVTLLEIGYAIGIAVGVLIFFNHWSGKKVTPQPTPVQVQMRDYEIKVDQTFAESVSRKGTEESVE